MKTIAEIRLENLELLISEQGTQDKVAEVADTSPVYISQLRNRSADSKTTKARQIGDVMARKLEAGCGKPVGWMDNVHAYPVGDATAPAMAGEQGAVYKWPAAGAWPFQTVGSGDFQKLSEFERGQVEGYIKGLLEAGHHARKSNGASHS